MFCSRCHKETKEYCHYESRNYKELERGKQHVSLGRRINLCPKCNEAFLERFMVKEWL